MKQALFLSLFLMLCVGSGTDIPGQDAQVPAASTPAFPQPYNTEKSSGLAQPAVDAAAQMVLPPGFAANVYVSEPDVRQPVAMTFDAKGRMWVVELYTYAEIPVNFAQDLRDRILILADTDGDGKVDERKVFWDGGRRITSVLPGMGGAYILAAPQMLFLPDADGDDIPDGPAEVLLDGFNDDRIRHTMVNGLKWGPDGWIYGRHGIQAWSEVGAPGTPEPLRKRVNSCIWRYHPLKKTFEVVCEGGTNPWGWDYNAEGEMFFINTVIGHFWHAIPGAFYKRMYGDHRRDHLYEWLDHHADHVHWATGEKWNDSSRGISDSTSAVGGGHAHTGLLVYQGNSFPSEWQGRVLTCNFLGRRLNAEMLAPNGSGFTAKHLPDFARMSDPWFRGIELITGPDGAVYVADWSDTGECHDNDGIHRATGRIFRIQYQSGKSHTTPDLSVSLQSDWVNLLYSANAWHWRSALRLLQEVPLESETIAALLTNATSADGPSLLKLRSFWALADRPEAEIVARQFLTRGDVSQRCWAVRWLVDHSADERLLADELTGLAGRENSPRVRLYLAGALQKLPLKHRLHLAMEISQDSGDNADHNLPLMIWYGIEELVAGKPELAPELFPAIQLNLVRKFIARRLFELKSSGSVPLSQILAQCLMKQDENGLDLALQGISGAAEEMDSAPLLPDWASVASHPSVVGNHDRLQQVVKLGALMGQDASLMELARRMRDTALPDKERQDALIRFFSLRPEMLSQQAGELLGDPVLVDALLPLLTNLPIDESAPLLFRILPGAGAPRRSRIVDVLVSRAEGAELLVNALEDRIILPNDVSALQARQVFSLDDDDLAKRMEMAWGVSRSAREDLQVRIQDWKSRLTPEEISRADLADGQVVFARACASCHKMFGQGGDLGPELTGSNRSSLDYLLENILDPNAVIPIDAQAVLVTLKDGQVFTGVGGLERGNQVTLRSPAGIMQWPAAKVLSVRPLGFSLMPEGILDTLSAGESRNLIGWLMHGEP